MSGGIRLFVLLIAVDLALGPLLTFVVAAPSKDSSVLRRDIAVIALIQIVALGYGMHAISLARPVLISFERVQFRVVSAADIEPSMLVDAPPALRELSWSGPRLIAAVKPSDPTEQLRSIDLGLAGFDLSLFPKNWRSYESQSQAAWEIARPATLLGARYPAKREELHAIARAAGRSVDELRFLPVRSRSGDWSALLAKSADRIVGYVGADGDF